MFETLSRKLSDAFASLRGQKELSEANVEEGLRAVRQALLEADVHFKVAREFTERVKARVLGVQKLPGVEAQQQFVHAFHKELVELLGGGEARLEFAKNPPTVILLAGLQGAGKTTTCGKLAKLLRDKHQRRPLLVAADVKRPAAVEQLRVLGRALNLSVFHEEGLAPPELCARGVAFARQNSFDTVLLDTAGRLHVDDELMSELQEIAQRTQPHAQLLVVDAMTGQDAVRSAEAFHARLKLTGLILTKLDGDARGGAAMSLKAVTGCPILFSGVGEKLDDLDAFSAERMAGRILGMGDVVGLVEKAQSAISEDEAQNAMEKMVLGRFTLEDQLQMMRMLKRLGPMKKVLGMLPGMGNMLDQVDLDDKRMKRLEALFTSMTPFERLHPDVLEIGRRRRIARGAGQEVGAVNELLKGYKAMGQVMKQMGRMGLGAQLGQKQKLETLRKLGGGAAGAGGLNAAGGLGGFGGLGGLGGLAGLGGAAGGEDAQPSGGLGGFLGAGGGGLGGLFGGNRPMGVSPTRQSAAKRKEKERKKKKKGRR